MIIIKINDVQYHIELLQVVSPAGVPHEVVSHLGLINYIIVNTGVDSTNLKIWRGTCKIWTTSIYYWRVLGSLKSSVFGHTCCRHHYSLDTSSPTSPTRHPVHRLEQSMDTSTHTRRRSISVWQRGPTMNVPVWRCGGRGPSVGGHTRAAPTATQTHTPNSCVTPVDNETVDLSLAGETDFATSLQWERHTNCWRGRRARETNGKNLWLACWFFKYN